MQADGDEAAEGKQVAPLRSQTSSSKPTVQRVSIAHVLGHQKGEDIKASRQRCHHVAAYRQLSETAKPTY